MAEFSVVDKKKLSNDFYLKSPEEVARELIGKAFVKKINSHDYISAEIVEAEAYLHNEDAASHSYPGRTRRNAPMFAKGGILYIYKSYGIHHCVNIVTENEGIGSAVLIRAAIPLTGIDVMVANRTSIRDSHRQTLTGSQSLTQMKYSQRLTQKKQNIDLCRGPGNFGKAFQLVIEDNYRSVTDDDIFLQEWKEITENDIGVSKRIGISKSTELPLRFYLKNSIYVSGNKL